MDLSPDMTRRSLLHHTLRQLEQGGIDEARRQAEWLLEHALGVSRTGLYAFPEHPVSPEQAAFLETLLTRRLQHEPVQYIVGYTEFFGLRFLVTSDVLIPRPETEQVTERGLARLASVPTPRVLDVGTGSGCIAVTIQHQRPDACVWACDLNPRALAVAAQNAVRHQCPVQFLEADLQAAGFAAQMPAELDLVVSNPPYILREEASSLAPEVRDFEPALALFVDKDPLQHYTALAHAAMSLLIPGGWLVVETHADFGGAVCNLLEQHGYASVQLAHDLAGKPRMVEARKPER